jgi:flagella basal body P-ring formation protein FlgA
MTIMRTRLRVMTAILIAALLVSRAANAAELSISLPSSIEAREGWFYLGEYAEINGERGIADSVSMAVISHNGSFARDDVLEALSATAAAGMSAVLSMPDVVQVLPESEIASELRTMTAWKWRVDVDVIPGTWEELIEGYSGYVLPPKIIPGARSLAIKLEDERGRQSTKQVKVTWYQPLVYSRRQLAKNDPVDLSALGQRIGTAAMMMTNFSSPEQISKAITRKAVNVFTPIDTGDVKQESFIRAGSTVTMVAKVNGLGIEVKGVAMQRGGLGDIIKVKNLSSKKVLKARIIGQDRVEINP